jgi:hypothetical protein
MKKSHILKRTAFIPLLLSSVLCAQEIPQKIIETGEKVSQELMKTLSSKLHNEIKTKGLIQAAAFCNTNALTLTEEVNLHQVQGVSIRRISLRERNPGNTPTADEKKVLESMQKMLEKKQLPSYLVEHEGKRYKYYKPLVIKKEACLKCHGDLSKNPELSQFMKEHYPFDKAQGYKMGDLRGAMVVEIVQ